MYASRGALTDPSLASVEPILSIQTEEALSNYVYQIYRVEHQKLRHTYISSIAISDKYKTHSRI